MNQRKYIRIALSQSDLTKLAAAKSKFEDQTGIKMSDSLFVLSIVRKAIDQN